MAETTRSYFKQKKFCAKTMAASIPWPVSIEKNMAASVFCDDRKTGHKQWEAEHYIIV